MPPQTGHPKSKAYAAPLATQADDIKYKTKYKELKAKLSEVEDDNAKLQLRILKSKKSIQRLRLERAILFDRLQGAAVPSNPYALKTKTHLEKAIAIPSIQDEAPYKTVHGDAARQRYLKRLNGQKVLDIITATDPFGSRPLHGVDAAASVSAPSTTTNTSPPTRQPRTSTKRKSVGRNSSYTAPQPTNGSNSNILVGGGINPSALLSSNGLPPPPAGTINPSQMDSL